VEEKSPPPLREDPAKFGHQLKSSNFFFREIWVSDPGTSPIGFVSKFCAIWRCLCVRNTDLEPDRTKIDFGTPLPKKSSKVCPNSAGRSGFLSMRMRVLGWSAKFHAILLWAIIGLPLNMPTPRPYIIISLMPQWAATQRGGQLFCLVHNDMVLHVGLSL